MPCTIRESSNSAVNAGDWSRSWLVSSSVTAGTGTQISPTLSGNRIGSLPGLLQHGLICTV